MIFEGNYKNDLIDDLYQVIYESFVDFYGKIELITKEKS